MKRSPGATLLALAALLLDACDGGGSPAHDAPLDQSDADSSADADAVVDADADLSAEADADASAESEAEPEADSSAEGDADSSADADADGDAGSDAAPDPVVEWAVGFGSAEDDGVAGLAAAADGSVVAAGLTGPGSVDFGDGVRGPFAYEGLFVASWDAAGALRWALRPVALGNAGARAVATGPSGTTYVCAEYQNTQDIGGRSTTSAGGTDVAVFAMDPAGTVVWLDSFGNWGNEFCHGLAVDEAQDRVWVTGAYMGDVDFGDGPLPEGSTSTNGFAAALDTAGALVWSRGWVTDQPAQNGGIAGDAAGNVYVTGAFLLSTDFFGTVVTATTSQDAFVLSLDPGGSFRWVRTYAGGYSEIGQDVARDPAGGVIVLATFEGTMPVGGTTLASRGAYDTALWTLDADGTVGRALSFGDAGFDIGSALVPADGGWVMGGMLRGSASYGGPVLDSGATDLGFLVGLDAAGAHRWTAGFDDDMPVVVSAAAAAGTATWAGGVFYAPLTLGAFTVTGGGERDVFLLRLRPP
ncbi:MAG: hypothetical protein HY907_19045 [Deltaproteobacteria bacterium]|nr:hypothetical protein [Deltaproteobacteria bacterium]